MRGGALLRWVGRYRWKATAMDVVKKAESTIGVSLRVRSKAQKTMADIAARQTSMRDMCMTGLKDKIKETLGLHAALETKL
jgi:hypothetical protein